jgi:phenylpyruvate tautomerase PptA (4-oxalocrotonate tautomerase family)
MLVPQYYLLPIGKGVLERFQAEGPRRKSPRIADPVESGAESASGDAGSTAAFVAEITERVHEWAQLESAVDRAIHVMFSDVPSEFDGRPL